MLSENPSRPTKAIIDLDKIASNFLATKEFVGRDISYMAVVKADGYGHGATQVATRLEAEGVDWFGVAIPEEAVELRAAGIARPILCLGSFWPGQENLLIDHNITPVVFQISQLESLDKLGRERNRRVDVHVKIDTGMGRVGIPFSEAAEFAKTVVGLPNLRVDGLLTHFAAAENPDENDFTRLQINRFDTACNTFRAAGHSPSWLDLANSPGAISCPAGRGNMVRLGGALYGLLDDILSPNTPGPILEPALLLRSEVAYLRNVARGTSLGYGRSFIAERDSVIALVPIGYADGYPRALSNVGYASIRNRRSPVVGRVSMDWTLFDVTDIEGVRSGDDVILIGPEPGQPTAADIAGLTGTIGYEITCGLTRRVPRIVGG
ncbi:MAG: alanine racemase [Pyrinomonadaceae bacterium]